VQELLQQRDKQVLFLVLEKERLKRLEPLLTLAKQAKIPIIVLDAALFKEVAVSETPQGVLAVVKIPTHKNFSEVLETSPACVVVMEEIQDPSNVGAIIRTASAVGASCVFYTKGTADPFSPKAVRASAGAVLNLPVIKIENLLNLTPTLKEKGFKLVATVVKGGEDLFTFSFPKKTVLLLGNEAKGLSAEGMVASDYKLTIPIIGKVESLNVAVAAGIVLYQWLIQRFYIVKT